MKRFFVLLCVFILLFAISRTSVSAVDREEIYKESGAAELEGDREKGLTDSLWSTLTTALTGGAGKAIKHGAMIVACLLLVAVLKGVSAIREESLSSSFDFVSAAVLGAASFPAVYGVFVYAKEAVESMHVFCLSLLPVTTTLYAMGGNTAQGLSAGAGMSLFLTVTETVNSRLLMPMLSTGFAFALTGLLPAAESIAPVGTFIKNCATTLITFVFSLVGFVFYFQTVITAAADGLAYRTVRFASGAFIPLIGNAVGDSARTVFGAVSTVKASVGALGLSVVMGYLLPPLVCILLYKASFSFCALFASLCGLEKQSKFIKELGALLGAALALLVACITVFIVISAVFLKSGVSA